jgi:hypothetical protein
MAIYSMIGEAQHPVSLRISLGTAADEVFRLEAGEPLLEVLMVLGGAIVQFVCFIRNIVNGVRTIYAHAALDAAADLLAEHSGHILFLVQVFLVLVNVIKAVDSFSILLRA